MKPQRWVFGLAACGSSQVASPPPIAPATAPPCSPLTTAPPKTFGKLFCAGASWELPGHIQTGNPPGGGDPWDPRTEPDTLRCSVEFPRQLKGGWSANLTCETTGRVLEKLPDELIATSSGLWQRDGLNEDLSKLDDKARVLVEPPVDSQLFEQLGPEGGGHRRTWQAGDAWCFTKDWGGMGYSGGWTLCLRDGDLVGAESFANNDEALIVGSWGIIKPQAAEP